MVMLFLCVSIPTPIRHSLISYSLFIVHIIIYTYSILTFVWFAFDSVK